MALVKLEREVAQEGYTCIAGVDEAGRGPLAGPVVAAACYFREPLFFPGINDSKLLSPSLRRHLFEELVHHPQVCYGLGFVSAEEIDQINILQATLKAMRAAVEALPERPDFLLVDGEKLVCAVPARRVVGGDRLSQLIAAASVIAKERRDALMVRYHEEYPCYGFDAHKGYGTKRHIEALKRYGPSPIHRKSFRWGPLIDPQVRGVP